MTTALLITIGVLVCLLVASVYRLMTLARQVLDLEDQVEESLDILDGVHMRIDKVLQIPVGSDDPIVRQVLSDIQYARTAILLIAQKITIFGGSQEDETPESDQGKE